MCGSDNLHGLIKWIEIPADCTEEQKEEISKQQVKDVQGNETVDNRMEDIKVKLRPTGKSLVQLADEENVCTFTFTGPNFCPTQVWECLTCKLTGRTGACPVCIRVCHEGHEVRLQHEEVPFFCDCGEGFEGCHFRLEVKEKVEKRKTYK